MTESRISSPSIVPDLSEENWIMIRGSPVKKRSIVLRGHKTSVSMEDPFWSQLRRLARVRNLTLSEQVMRIEEKGRGRRNLSSAIRLWVLFTLKAERQNRRDGIGIDDTAGVEPCPSRPTSI